MPTPSKACPFCGELIVSSALKCRFCGEALDPDQYEQTRREIGSQARIRRPSTKPYPPLAPHLPEEDDPAAAKQTPVGNDTARQWALSMPPLPSAGDELVRAPAAAAPAQTPIGDELAREPAAVAPAQTPIGSDTVRERALAREPAETLDFPSIDELPAVPVPPRAESWLPRQWYARPPVLAGAALLLALVGAGVAYLIRTPATPSSDPAGLQPDARPRPAPTASPLAEAPRAHLGPGDARALAVKPAVKPSEKKPASRPSEKKPASRPSEKTGAGGSADDDADSELDFPSPYGDAKETKTGEKRKKPRNESASDEDVLFDPYGGADKKAK